MTIFRFYPSLDKEPRHQVYEVPFTPGMTVMNTLDYIYDNLDSGLAYHNHTGCYQHCCGRCSMRINGKAGLACATTVQRDITLEPLPKLKVIKDLVVEKM